METRRGCGWWPEEAVKVADGGAGEAEQAVFGIPCHAAAGEVAGVAGNGGGEPVSVPFVC